MYTGLEYVELEISTNKDELIIIPPTGFWGDNRIVKMYTPAELFDFLRQNYFADWGNTRINTAKTPEFLDVIFFFGHAVGFSFLESNDEFQWIHIYTWQPSYAKLVGKLCFDTHDHPIRQCTVMFKDGEVIINPIKNKNR